jgi:hypothetical protein
MLGQLYEHLLKRGVRNTPIQHPQTSLLLLSLLLLLLPLNTHWAAGACAACGTLSLLLLLLLLLLLNTHWADNACAACPTAAGHHHAPAAPAGPPAEAQWHLSGLCAPGHSHLQALQVDIHCAPAAQS